MSAFTFPVHNRVAQVENDVMSTDEHDDGTEAKPAAPAEWRSPTMLTPEELESLRQEAKRSSEWARATLAARRAKA